MKTFLTGNYVVLLLANQESETQETVDANTLIERIADRVVEKLRDTQKEKTR